MNGETILNPIKKSIGKIRCKVNDVISRGTGFLIRTENNNLIVTARHVVEDFIECVNSRNVNEKQYEVTITFENNTIIKINQVVYEDVHFDIAFLRLEKAFGEKNINILNFGKFTNFKYSKLKGLKCEIFGYPDSEIESARDLRSDEIIEDIQGYLEAEIRDTNDRHIWDLHISIPGGKSFDEYDGYSGSPIVIKNNIIGVWLQGLSPALGSTSGVISVNKLEKALNELIKIENTITINEFNNENEDNNKEKDIISFIPSIGDYYYERLDVLEKVYNVLHSEVPVCVITGFGGYGKTQITSRYVNLHKNEYEIVYWLDATNSKSLELNYREFAKKIGIEKVEGFDQLESLISIVEQKLSLLKNILIVFDNAIEPRDIKRLIPKNTSVIINSRYRVWTSFKNTQVPIEVLDNDEAADFLIERTKDKDRRTANKLAEVLGGLPLALEQAGAFIAGTPFIDMRGYLDRYNEYLNKNEAKLIDLYDSEAPVNYSHTVYTTWEVTFDYIEKKYKEVLPILNICGYFSSENITLNLFLDNLNYINKYVLDDSNYDDFNFKTKILNVLYKYSLINVSNQNISMHRLVQSVIRINSLSKKSYFEKHTLLLLSNTFHVDLFDSSKLLTIKELLPHALMVIDRGYGREQIPNEEVLISILKITASLSAYFIFIRDYKNAENHLEFSKYLANHYKYLKGVQEASIFVDIISANLLLNSGKLQEARDTYERIIKNEGLSSEVRMSLLFQLGNSFKGIDNTIALQFFEIVLDEDLATSRGNNESGYIKILDDYNNIIRILIDMSEMDDANFYINHAKEVFDKISSNHVSKAEFIENQGYFLMKRGEYKSAINILETSIKILENLDSSYLGHFEPIYNILGLCYYNNEDDIQAKKYFILAKETNLRIFQGKTNVNLANINNQLGLIESAEGLYTSATNMFHNSLSILKEFSFENTLNYAAILYNLAYNLYLTEGNDNLLRAKKELEECMKIEFNILGAKYSSSGFYKKRLSLLKLIQDKLG